jgi:hypothetical protein
MKIAKLLTLASAMTIMNSAFAYVEYNCKTGYLKGRGAAMHLVGPLQVKLLRDKVNEDGPTSPFIQIIGPYNNEIKMDAVGPAKLTHALNAQGKSIENRSAAIGVRGSGNNITVNLALDSYDTSRLLVGTMVFNGFETKSSWDGEIVCERAPLKL